MRCGGFLGGVDVVSGAGAGTGDGWMERWGEVGLRSEWVGRVGRWRRRCVGEGD